MLCCALLEQCICKIRKVYLWEHAAVYLWGDTVMYLWGHTVVYLWGQTSVFVRADPSVFVTEEERSCYSRCSFRYFRLVYSHSQNSSASTFTFPYFHIKICDCTSSTRLFGKHSTDFISVVKGVVGHISIYKYITCKGSQRVEVQS